MQGGRGVQKASQRLGLVEAIHGDAPQKGGLLPDLLLQVVAVAVQRCVVGLPAHLLHCQGYGGAGLRVEEVRASGSQRGHLAVAHEDEPARVIEKSGHV